MEKYKTKQKEIILKYLKQNFDKDLTVEMIVAYLIKKNKKCSQTTVYRYLKQLVENGVVRKYYIDNSTSSYYQFIKNEKCKDHMHFKCEKCRKTLHLDKDDMDIIESTIESDYNIKLNPSKIILYGKCKDCI